MGFGDRPVPFGQLLRCVLWTTGCCALLACPPTSLATRPAAAPGAEARAIEKTIRAQIDAFARDDANAAFAFATPKIKQIFGQDPARFLRTVRESYPAVYRPRSMFFLPPKHQGETWLQVVNVADAEGKLWLAYYDMRRQPDRSWKINGCQLVETDAMAI